MKCYFGTISTIFHTLPLPSIFQTNKLNSTFNFAINIQINFLSLTPSRFKKIVTLEFNLQFSPLVPPPTIKTLPKPKRKIILRVYWKFLKHPEPEKNTCQKQFCTNIAIQQIDLITQFVYTWTEKGNPLFIRHWKSKPFNSLLHNVGKVDAATMMRWRQKRGLNYHALWRPVEYSDNLVAYRGKIKNKLQYRFARKNSP